MRKNYFVEKIINFSKENAEIPESEFTLWEKSGWYKIGEKVIEGESPIVNTLPIINTTNTIKVDVHTTDIQLTEQEFIDSIECKIITPVLAKLLYKSGIRSKAQLRNTDDSKLLAINGIGKAKIADIRNAIKD